MLSVVAFVAAGLVLGLVAIAAVRRPRLALIVLVVVTMSNAGAVLDARVGLPASLAATALAAAALGLGVVTGRLPLRSSAVVLLLGVALALLVPSVLTARSGELAWSRLLELVRELVGLVLLVGLARAAADAATVARWATGTLAAVAGLTLVNAALLGSGSDLLGFSVISASEGVGTTIPRHQGPFDDPNFYGRVLVLGVPFAMALVTLAWGRRRWRAVALWSLALVALCGAVFLTGSRGAMVSVAVATVVWMLLAGPGPRRGLVVLPVAVGLALLVPGVGSRLASLADLNADPFAEVDYSLVERTAALEVRLAVFADNPALGVGPGNTSLVWTDYMTAAGTGITREVAAHNLYLEAAAESGVLGILAWLLFLGGVVVIGLSHVRVHRVRGREAVPIDRLLAAAVVAAVAGWAVASIFLHLAFFGTLLVVVAVLGAMRLELPAQPPPRDPDRLRVVGRRVLVGAAVVAVAGAALGAVHLTQRERVWVAEVPISLVPVNEPGLPAADPYTQSVTSYTRTIATYAAVVDAVGRPLVRDRDDVTMSVVGTGAEAVFAVRVESTDRRAAQQAALRVARAGDAFVDASPGLTALASTQLGRPTLASDQRSPLSLP